MSEQVFISIDLGASGGRVVAALFDGARFRLEEVERFPNGGIYAAGRLQWDILNQWSHILTGLRKAHKKYGNNIISIGVDTWGVDFGFLGEGDELLGNPIHYRDKQHEGMMDEIFSIVPRKEVFQHTGLQFMDLNSLYQLYAMHKRQSPLLTNAKRFLMIPDLFHWLLTGEKTNERTNATTTQFYDPTKRDWSYDLLNKLNLPTNIFSNFIDPGDVIGGLQDSVITETGLKDVKVIAPGTHDTASAVLAVPAESPVVQNPNWCYVSSGTWSLMGAEVLEPVVNDDALEYNFTNEGGVGGTIRLLKNITGLWLVQECRRIWEKDGASISWEALVQDAENAVPLQSFIDPDAGEFSAPTNMPEAIQEFCKRTNQEIPRTNGEIVRCCIDSLAMKQRFVLNRLEKLTESQFEVIHVIGGGTQNKLLCQATSDATGRRLVAGPIEATALGNALQQAITHGSIGSILEGRKVIANSFDLIEYQPHQTEQWDEAYNQRFLPLL